jgi:GNAT superfamily N-acetyltransferase
MIEIFSARADVQPYIQAVSDNADSDRDALGFFPFQVYESATEKSQLLIAVTTRNGRRECVGHLLYGGRFPTAKIHQMFVALEYRRKGLASRLVSELVHHLEQCGFLWIRARVASDLQANFFWEEEKFFTVKTIPGGTSRNRTINIRQRQLNTPTLFGYIDGEPTAGLAIHTATSESHRVFSIDLNVFFDVTKQRPRAELAGQIIAAALDNLIRLVVAEEFTTELERNRNSGTDPVLEFALQIPTMSKPSDEFLKTTLPQLAEIVFPNRASHLSIQDTSDLIHIATAIYHSASGFITAENALVAAAEKIQSVYGIQVVHVSDMASIINQAEKRISLINAKFSENDLRVSELTEELRNQAKTILERLHVSDSLNNLLTPSGIATSSLRTIAIAVDEKLCALAIWHKSDLVNKRYTISILANEEHPALDTALDALFYCINQELSSKNPVLIELQIPLENTVAHTAALRYGYLPSSLMNDGFSRLQRIPLVQVVSKHNWASIKPEIELFTKAKLPETLPSFARPKTTLVLTEADSPKSITLTKLERYLSPAIFSLDGRDVTIVTVRRKYSDLLINTSMQSSFLPTDAVSIFHRRVYYSSIRNMRLLQGGNVVLFYESGKDGGRSAIIAIARVCESIKIPKSDISIAIAKQGVLNSKEIEALSKKPFIAATVFENVMCFPQPIGFKFLQAIGAADGANLVAAKPITVEQLELIVKEGLLGA